MGDEEVNSLSEELSAFSNIFIDEALSAARRAQSQATSQLSQPSHGHSVISVPNNGGILAVHNQASSADAEIEYNTSDDEIWGGEMTEELPDEVLFGTDQETSAFDGDTSPSNSRNANSLDLPEELYLTPELSAVDKFKKATGTSSSFAEDFLVTFGGNVELAIHQYSYQQDPKLAVAERGLEFYSSVVPSSTCTSDDNNVLQKSSSTMLVESDNEDTNDNSLDHGAESSHSNIHSQILSNLDVSSSPSQSLKSVQATSSAKLKRKRSEEAVATKKTNKPQASIHQYFPPINQNGKRIATGSNENSIYTEDSSQPSRKRKSNKGKAVITSAGSKVARAKKVHFDKEDKEDKEVNYGALEEEDTNKSYKALPAEKLAKRERDFKPISGTAGDTPPIRTISEMFAHMGAKAELKGLFHILRKLSKSLKLATLCSGTDSPILGLEMIFSWYLQTYGENFRVEHAMSAELVPQKQRFIMRNFKPEILLRDVMDLLRANFGKALTVYGNEVDVPTNVDVAVSGFACVDFSRLNSNKKALDDGGESGDTFNATRTFANNSRPKILVLENVSGAPWQQASLKNQAKNINRKGIDKQMEDIGFAVAFSKFDTKDYYIPHTRVRGYMVCTDIEAWYNLLYGTTYSKKAWVDWLNQVAKDLEGGMKKLVEQIEELRGFLSVACDEWITLVKYFKSPANVPVEEFLIPVDSYLLDPLRSDKRDKSRKPTAWKSCQIGHEKYRNDIGVGSKRPLTEWISGGSMNLPDYFDPNPGLVERTLDTLDIAHMRSAQRGYDDREYCRVLELSQNVYRVEDMTQNGIVGCLMPSGHPWSTVRGRRINGVEAMLLQGLPIERLDFSGLTQADLQDLAGNAMTSTVVNAAILAALISFEEILEKKVVTETTTEDEQLCDVMDTQGAPLHCSKVQDSERIANTEDSLKYGLENAFEYTPKSVSSVIQLAAQTIQYCSSFCTKLSKAYYKCGNCDHTACKSHFGKPRHDYKPFPIKFADEDTFVGMIKEGLPRMWAFKIDSGGNNWRYAIQQYLGRQEHPYDYKTMGSLQIEIETALRTPLWSQSLERVGRTWEVKYESQVAILICTVSETSVEWLFWLNGTKKSWNDEKGKQMRNFPILRMKPVGLDLTLGHWEFWLPHTHDISATVTSGGVLVDSYRRKIGIKRFNRDLVATEVTLKLNKQSDRFYFESNIEGTYRLHQECGQAFETMHVRQADSSRKVFLFLDHEFREGHPETHPFVITNDRSKLFCRVPRRDILGRLKDSKDPKNPDQTSYWRQPITLASEVVHEGIPAETKCQQIKIEIRGRWAEPFEISFDTSRNLRIDYGHLSRNFSLEPLHSCENTQTVFHAQTQLPLGFDPLWIMEQTLEITSTAAPELLCNLKWVVDKILKNADHSVSVERWMNHTADDLTLCKTCSPNAPNFHWIIHKFKGQAKLKITPLEDWRETSEYELRVKNRPTGLVAKMQVQRDGKVNIKIEANAAALMHQAKSSLAMFGGSETIKTSWRLISNDVQRRAPKLGPLNIKDVTDDCGVFELPQHAKNYLKDTLILHKCQLQALRWMVERENTLQVFVEEDIVEERVVQLNHAAWGKAERRVSRPGSLAAFNVGFGKTILTIALMATQRPKDEQWANQPWNDAIPIKATMVFVPTQLTLQWKEEIEAHSNFLKESILCITSIAQLRKMKIQQFLDADVIIISDRIYGWKPYKDRVANFSGTLAGALATSDASSRAWYAWHKSAVCNIREFLPILRHNPSMLQNTIEDTHNHNLEVARQLKTLLPSKRYTGDEYIQAKEAAKKIAAEEQKAAVWRSNNSVEYLKGATKTDTNKGTKKGSQAQIAIIDDEAIEDINEPAGGSSANKSSAKLQSVEEGGVEVLLDEFKYKDDFGLGKLQRVDGYKSLAGPVLEMFAPARLVIDEYHYHKENSLLFSLLLTIGEKANTRLLLSATPKLCSFNDIKSMAKLLQVNLGADDYRSMPHDVYLSKTGDLTTREKLMVSGHCLSAALLQRRHDHAQRFLDVFSRTGEAPPISNKRVDTLLPVGLPAVQLYSYNMMQQEIENYQMENLQENQDPISDLLQEACLPEYKDCEETYRRHYENMTRIEGQFFNELTKVVHLQNLCNEDWDGMNIEEWNPEEWLNRGDDWIRMALAGTLADPECDQKITAMIEAVKGFINKNNFSTLEIFGDKAGMIAGKKKSAQHGHLPVNVAALSDSVANLNELRSSLINQVRLVRVSQTVLRVHTHDALDCDSCGYNFESRDLEVLSRCGHIFCGECFLSIIDNNQCSVPQCFATARSYQMMSGCDLARKALEPSDGAKPAAILALIQRIVQKNEKVIVFAQNLRALDHLKANLKKEAITCTDLHNAKQEEQKATALMSFAKENNKFMVLLLNIGDASASGSNLTAANHVIFMSPYHVEGSDGQREYDAAMKQAIGRALRMGQMKDRPVHVYQFFAKKTVDVDLLEHRNSMILKGVGIEDGVEIAAFFDKSWGDGDYTSPCAQMLCRPDEEYA